MEKFYVYFLLREDNGTPFYVGKGVRNRWLNHEKSAVAGEESHKARIIRKVIADLGHLPKKKVAEGLTEEDAFALEILLIAEIGRYPDGPLVNKTDGGEGFSESAWADPEYRALLIEGMKRTWSNPVLCKLRSQSMRDGWARRRASGKVKPNSGWYSDPETKALTVALMREAWADPDKKASRVQSMMLARAANPPKSRKKSENRDVVGFAKKITANWADDEYRAAQIERIKRVWADPALVEKASTSAIASWKDPERKARRMQAMRDGWARRRARLAAPKAEDTC